MFAGMLLMFGIVMGRTPVAEATRPQTDAEMARLPFERYTVRDRFRRDITFYLSRPPKDSSAKLPIALLIQGSGSQSIFTKIGDRIGGSYQYVLLQAAQGRVRVLAVEKPGVQFLDRPSQPGTGMGASKEFLSEHTLPRWAEANEAALKSAWTQSGVDSTRTLVLGHSEGGLVAARVAADLSRVSHVANLAGGGPNQLFDLAEMRAQPRAGEKPGDAQQRLDRFYEEWNAVRANPDSITDFWLGHPYRRWSTFCATSVINELLRSHAIVYAAQGTADVNVAPKAHDVLVAELRARGRDVTSDKIEGADHGFNTPDMPRGAPTGMKAMFGKILDWFLSGYKVSSNSPPMKEILPAPASRNV